MAGATKLAREALHTAAMALRGAAGSLDYLGFPTHADHLRAKAVVCDEALAALSTAPGESEGAGEFSARELLDEFERLSKAFPVGHERKDRGASSYAWRTAHLLELRDLAETLASTPPAAPAGEAGMRTAILAEAVRACWSVPLFTGALNNRSGAIIKQDCIDAIRALAQETSNG